MPSDFSRTLALLRKEKKISQRTAAGDLKYPRHCLATMKTGCASLGLVLSSVQPIIMGSPVIICWGAAWRAMAPQFPQPFA